MAGQKSFNARIQHKRNAPDIWESKNPVLLDGEIIFVDMVDGTMRTKVGDGVSTYNQLGFSDQSVYSALEKKCDASTAVDCVLVADNWSNGQQTVDVDGITIAMNGIVGLPQNYTGLQYEAVLAAELAATGQGDGTLTFSANADVPQIDIPITVILMG